MGNVTMEGGQKFLHLDAKYENFPTWEELLEFEVDGVPVAAIATHKWREEIIRVVAPFEVEGSDYLQGFRPPLMCLGAGMTARRKLLASQGLTERDDCIRMATDTYRLQSTFLRIKPEIDRAQHEFLSVFRVELEQMFDQNARVQGRVSAAKLALRQKLRGSEIDPKAYQIGLRSLQKEAAESDLMYWRLKDDVDRELENIKILFVGRALEVKRNESSVLKLTNPH